MFSLDLSKLVRVKENTREKPETGHGTGGLESKLSVSYTKRYQIN